MQRKVYYRGTRLVGAKLCHHFCDEHDEGWYYPKAKKDSFLGIVVGQAYMVETEDGTTTFPRLWYSAKVDGDVHSKRDQWQAETRAHTEMYKARGASITPELDALVEELMTHVRGMSHNKKAHFITYLITRFTKFI